MALGALIGFASGIKVFLVAHHPDDADVTAITYRVDNQRDAAGKRAAKFVAAVLSTPESRRAEVLQRFITLPEVDTVAQSAPAADPAPAVIDTPEVWSVVPTGTAGEANLYSVIVTVEQRPYASAPPTTAYYRVPMSIWRYQPRPMDMPTPISDPGPGADITLRYDHALSPTSPVYAVVAGFINTYLTSTSGLDRYVVADSWIKPIWWLPERGHPHRRGRRRGARPARRRHANSCPGNSDCADTTICHSSIHIPADGRRIRGGTWMIADIDLTPQVATDSDTKPAGRTQP